MKTSESERLGRQAAATAALCAALTPITVVTMTRGYSWLGFVLIGLQAVLLILAMSLLAKSKQPAAGKD